MSRIEEYHMTLTDWQMALGEFGNVRVVEEINHIPVILDFDGGLNGGGQICATPEYRSKLAALEYGDYITRNKSQSVLPQSSMPPRQPPEPKL